MTGPGKDLRTVIVDDHELLRSGTRGILEEASGFTVVGEAADAESARQVVAETMPDLVITDIRLPTVNGIDLASQLVDDHPGLVVVILSAYDDDHYVRAAMAAGVAGYLLKTMPSHELVVALRDACEGHGGLGLGGMPQGRGEKDPTGATTETDEQLTAREAEVVGLVARGMSNKAIARQLGISTRTVEGHLNHVFDKLGILSRTELVHFALANRHFARDAPVGESPVGPDGTQ
ncbi:MAG: response regulator transcription factor [Acidimicrobiales bacterium]